MRKSTIASAVFRPTYGSFSSSSTVAVLILIAFAGVKAFAAGGRTARVEHDTTAAVSTRTSESLNLISANNS